jgi:hypothetical protein
MTDPLISPVVLGSTLERPGFVVEPFPCNKASKNEDPPLGLVVGCVEDEESWSAQPINARVARLANNRNKQFLGIEMLLSDGIFLQAEMPLTVRSPLPSATAREHDMQPHASASSHQL